MTFTVRELQQVDEPSLIAAVDVLDRAFGRKFFLPRLGNQELCAPLIESILKAAFLEPAALVHVAESPEDGIVGVAVWFGPGGRWMNDEISRQESGFYDILEKAGQKYKDYWLTQFLPAYDANCEKIFGEGVKLAGYHLQQLGVDPAHHRKGIGKLLIRHLEAIAKLEGASSVIETIALTPDPKDSNPYQFYTALGYTASEALPLPQPGDEKDVYMYGFVKTADKM